MTVLLSGEKNKVMCVEFVDGGKECNVWEEDDYGDADDDDDPVFCVVE